MGSKVAPAAERSTSKPATLSALLHSSLARAPGGLSRPFARMGDTELRAPPSTRPDVGLDFSRVAVYSNRTRELAIGRTDDPAEAEADRVAEQVMRMPAATLPLIAGAPILRRKCTDCAADEGLESDQLRRTATDVSGEHHRPDAPAIVHQALQSPGAPLDPTSRGFMEQRLGYDFSRVRIHADGLASRSADAVDSRAYTVGSNVVFRQGEYAPGTVQGLRLLAHELTHVIQQGAGGSRAQRVQRQPDASAQDKGGASKPMDGAEEGQHACVVKEQIGTITTPVAVFDDMVMMQTEVDIEWQPPASKLEPIHAITYCDCACGEYRQYVKGHIIKNGQRFDIGLCDGARLEENVWHEDGDPAVGVCDGHRDRKESPNDIFDRPNREWGCHYHGKDEPKVPGKAGDQIDVDLKFKGQTYDKVLNRFGQIHEWAFTYKGKLG